MAYHDTQFPAPSAEAPPRTDDDGADPAPRGDLKPTPAAPGVRPCEPEGRLYE